MANLKDVKSKAVKITLLDGVERTVKLTLNAMAELEERYGSIEKAFAELDKGSMKALRCVLWAAFVEDDPEITERQVGSLIDVQYMQTLMEKLGEAFTNDMPQNSADPAFIEAKAAEVAKQKAELVEIIENDPNA